MQQQVDLQQAVNITQQLLGMMYKYYDNRKDANGNAVANQEVLLSLKHAQLLLRPYLIMLSEDQRNVKNSMQTLPARELPLGVRDIPVSHNSATNKQNGYFIPGHP